MIVAIPALLKKEAIFLIALMLLDGAAISYIKSMHVQVDEYHPHG